jgi:hypothetical protein
MEKIRNKKLSIAGTLQYLPSFSQQEASQSVEPPQRAAIPSKPRRLRGFFLSSIHYNQSRNVHVNQRHQYIRLI